MKINFDIKNLEFEDYEIAKILRERLFQERDEAPKLETRKDGSKAFVYYTDDWRYEHRDPERHTITTDPEEIKVIEAFQTISKYLEKHAKPI